MADDLLRGSWAALDSGELRLLLDQRIGGPGQYSSREQDPNKLYLPLAGDACRLALTFRDGRITVIGRGPAFDTGQWEQIAKEIDTSLLDGPTRVGRDYSFSGFRVTGWWRGARSGVQILPPPETAPRASVEMAEHPFILEFPLRETGLWRITNHRRMQLHRKLTLLLNVLLAGRTCLQPRRPGEFWAVVPNETGALDIRWVQQFFFGPQSEVVIDGLSTPTGERLQETEPEEYFERVGYDGLPLRVPTDLDEWLCRYLDLEGRNRANFDRATFWLDMASREWTVSVSSSFAALVSAVESLTERGDVHHFACPTCSESTQHEVPGPTRRFRDFFETYAPGAALGSRRAKMYELRSGILHGGKLIQLDQGSAFGWDPSWWNERELHWELWKITRMALRNWLGNPPGPRV